MSENTVMLQGGPWDGQTVPRPSDRSLLVQDGDEPYVARYRQSRDRGVFRFQGYDKVVARISPPSTEEAPAG